jgi:hypothetical protein
VEEAPARDQIPAQMAGKELEKPHYSVISMPVRLFAFLVSSPAFPFTVSDSLPPEPICFPVVHQSPQL